MNDREKLIELIQAAVGCCTEYWSGLIADHLLANGVTFQQWIPVSERRPEENDVYIVSALDGHDRRITFAQWQNRLKRWYLTGARSYWKVTHWMPLPEPPKGELQCE